MNSSGREDCGAGCRASILIADNNAQFRSMVEEFLTHEGYATSTASSPAEARQILQCGEIDLAIIDLRLFDDDDAKDVSGLTVAQEISPRVPKILLTGYLAVEELRDRVQGGTVLSKNEGFEALLRSVKIGLLSLEPLLTKNVLRAFQLTAAISLPTRIQEVGPEEATHRVLQSLDATRSELKIAREQENRRASQHHLLGLIGVAIGLLIIMASVVLLMLQQVTASVASMVVSLVVHGLSTLQFVREDVAHKRVRVYYEELEGLNRMGNLIEICGGLISTHDRDKYRKKIIDHLLGQWLTRSNAGTKTTKAQGA
jgi:CheY-like chemotaxis protein